jgi:hypothetical protein
MLIPFGSAPHDSHGSGSIYFLEKMAHVVFGMEEAQSGYISYLYLAKAPL